MTETKNRNNGVYYTIALLGIVVITIVCIVCMIAIIDLAGPKPEVDAAAGKLLFIQRYAKERVILYSYDAESVDIQKSPSGNTMVIPLYDVTQDKNALTRTYSYRPSDSSTPRDIKIVDIPYDQVKKMHQKALEQAKINVYIKISRTGNIEAHQPTKVVPED